MQKAIIVGGTGQIGQATARLLSDQKWDVTLVSRNTRIVLANCRHVEADASDTEKLGELIGTDTDLLLSCVAFTAVDAECLAHAGRKAGRIVAISSASVYRDFDGRTLDEASECGFPDFPLPLNEASPTVAAGPETGTSYDVSFWPFASVLCCDLWRAIPSIGDTVWQR